MSKRKRLSDDNKNSKSEEASPFRGTIKCTTLPKLLDLLQAGEVEMFKTLAPKFLIANYIGFDGSSFLHSVVIRGCQDGYDSIKEVLEFILQEAPKLTSFEDIHGNTPLMLACVSFVCPELIVRLAESNVDAINQHNTLTGDSPLLAFLKNFVLGAEKGRGISLENCCRVLEHLCTLGKNLAIENKINNENALMILFSRKDISYDNMITLAEILFKHGASLINSKETNAIQKLHKLTFKLLEILNTYCSSDEITKFYYGDNVIRHVLKTHQLGFNSNPEIPVNDGDLLKALQILFFQKPVPFLKKAVGCTIIRSAILTISHVNFEVIKFLTQQTENVNINSLPLGCLNKYATSVENINDLVQLGFNPNTYCSNSKNLPLEEAAMAKNQSAVIKLIEVGADLVKVKHSTVFMNFVTNDNSVDLLKYIINVPSMKKQDDKSKQVTSFYCSLLLAIFRNMNDNNREITKLKLDIILKESTTNNIPISKKYRYAHHEFRLRYINVYGISIVLFDCDYKNNNEIKYLIRFIKIMIECGFKITDLSDFNPLTTFLLAVHKSGINKEKYFNSLILRMADLLIQYGVDMQDSRLIKNIQFIGDKWITDSCEYSVRTLAISDVLFLSLWYFKNVELVQKMLMHWWGPPITLTAILPVFQTDEWNEMYLYYNSTLVPFFVKFGHLPYGTSLVPNEIWSWMTMWKEGRDFDENTSKILEIRSPLRLQDLCKYVVRKKLSLTYATSGRDISMPDLMNQVLPYDLPSVIHNKL